MDSNRSYVLTWRKLNDYPLRVAMDKITILIDEWLLSATCCITACAPFQDAIGLQFRSCGVTAMRKMFADDRSVQIIISNGISAWERAAFLSEVTNETKQITRPANIGKRTNDGICL
jgi:hypothetical protein